ncbi:MAG: oxidoreductase [Parcubacteria group bacterium CG11_big_fil_rev_8_21_14_0_20_39_14]|nr:MAG: oxidoreductase [Parcubacteria group bacterium CG11_big_fil_rev_8_21_14_0_20_39_14]PIS35090.1 MAG: oxidoreductase [Parcubacteria group bacterium CG08_land_8_20_14_0_20_38_56]
MGRVLYKLSPNYVFTPKVKVFKLWCGGSFGVGVKNIYLPQKVKIAKIKKLSYDVKLFRFKKPRGVFPVNKNKLAFIPGQFVLAGLWGYGEAPFGIASSPYENSFIDIVVRNTGGRVTSALHNLKKGAEITLRGPYGNGFPLSFLEGKDVIMISGGCGIPPIASLTEYIIKNRKKFGNVYLLYGVRTPKDILIKGKMKEWEKYIRIILTIDKPYPGWKGCTGFVCNLIQPAIKVSPGNAVAAMCGPGPMTDATEKVLRPLGIADRRIFVSEERRMQCGVGKCQHCTTGEKYVCLDGPVFNYDEIDKNWD